LARFRPNEIEAVAFFAFGFVLLSSAALAKEQLLFARVTVYWASGGNGSDSCTRQHKCATGARLRAGHCAVDPKKIPYGSKVVFQDATCVAVDTGRDVINRKAARRSGRTPSQRNALVIDRFFETKRQALSWASAHPHFMTVRVLSPNEQLAENKQGAQMIARKGYAPIPRVSSVVLSERVNVPQKTLFADNVPRSSFLPRRF
jgi:hypothetical protein